jgi:hypothetical protein
MRNLNPAKWLLLGASAAPVGRRDCQQAGADKRRNHQERDVCSAIRRLQGATIVTAGADGKMTTIRKGTNGFTCMADNPETPGPDPMCMDANAMEWVHAWIEHKAPTAGKVGFMYMLAGGTDASNTDPYGTKPQPNNHWVETGPHVMVVGAKPDFYGQYPKKADPDTSQPYIMWPGTPYQHVMIPVK